MQLIGCLETKPKDSATEEEKQQIKEDVALRISAYALKLMPGGTPDFSEIKYYPSLHQIRHEYGDAKTLKILVALIDNFNQSINAVRPMTAVQMNDVAFMILSEYGSYRLEDVVMFFSMAKTGKLGRIYDRIDIQTISQFLIEYDKYRALYGQLEQEKQEYQKEKEFKQPVNEVSVDTDALIKQMKEERQKRHEEGLKEFQNDRKFTFDEALEVMKIHDQNTKNNTP